MFKILKNYIHEISKEIFITRVFASDKIFAKIVNIISLTFFNFLLLSFKRFSLARGNPARHNYKFEFLNTIIKIRRHSRHAIKQ